ncbi:MAG TPA: nuclear transport factor 2 family protein [Thermoanaerobaculia bacterium]|jgi:hypothetical protein
MSSRTIPSLAAAALAAVATVAGAAPDPPEIEAVKAVVQSAYVEGVHIRGDGAAMRKGFHPDFHMLVLKDGAMQSVSLEEWIGRIEGRAKDPAAQPPDVRAKFPVVEISGNAAVARVELTRNGKHTFTDFLALYRFPAGWMIVGKIFQAHP